MTPASSPSSPSHAELRIAVIGLGVMGRTHINAYSAAAKANPCRLIAVCSPDPAQLSGTAGSSGNLKAMASGERLFDPATVRTTTDPRDIASDPSIDIVSICSPTDSHADLAIMMLRAGKHVLVEKPVALTSSEVERVAAAARESGRACMPAMCMRFWPGWDWLKDRVIDRQFGAVRSAVFTRVGSRPDWSREFYHDSNRTGGAMFDLHVHDADIILWLFGPPRSVRSMGSLDHITTMYEFARGPAHVIAEGAWVTAPGFPFRMRFTVEFEHAVADWDLSRAEQLLLTRAGSTSHVPLPQESAYNREIAHFLECIRTNTPTRATLADALEVTRLLESEKRGLKS